MRWREISWGISRKTEREILALVQPSCWVNDLILLSNWRLKPHCYSLPQWKAAHTHTHTHSVVSSWHLDTSVARTVAYKNTHTHTWSKACWSFQRPSGIPLCDWEHPPLIPSHTNTVIHVHAYISLDTHRRGEEVEGKKEIRRKAKRKEKDTKRRKGGEKKHDKEKKEYMRWEERKEARKEGQRHENISGWSKWNGMQ